jgi:hypothetical protein
MRANIVVLQSRSYGYAPSPRQARDRTVHHSLFTHIFYHFHIKKQFPEVPFNEFESDYQEILEAENYDPHAIGSIPFADLIDLMQDWIADWSNENN